MDARKGASVGAERRERGARTLLRKLYWGYSRRAVACRYGLLVFDIVTIIYLVVSSFCMARRCST